MVKLQKMKNNNKNKLKTFLIIAINVIFAFALFVVEFQYISSTRKQTVKQNEESFLNTNTSLVSMTENYLVGESHLCRSWSNYLNNNVQTIEDAIAFVKESISDKDVMGHIVYKNGLTGLSTNSYSSDKNKYDINYSSLSSSVFTSDEEGIRISSSYINPVNGSPSIAFYHDIKLIDPDDNTKEVDAYLLRVVLRDNFRQRWTFPSGSFEHMQVTIMDKSGNYIIAGRSFKNSNFFEFYKSYNRSSNESINKLIEEVTTNTGLFKMNDSSGEECYIAYSHFTSYVDWVILTYTPAKDITTVTIDWSLIIILGAGLLAIFVIDLAILLTLNKNLSDTAKVADSANRAKTDFLSTMSHDIRTPMNAIIGLTELAKNEPNNPAPTQDALKKIELASNHLLTLINDILDLSKIESGRLSINPLDFSVVDMFENLVNITRPQVKAKGLDFSFRVHHFKNEWLFADKLRLSQIFTNLLSNAVKYSLENGKVCVDVFEEQSDKEGCARLVYRVQDTGIGMSEEFMAKMYEPFSRATDSRVNSIRGTGLGLAITKRMIDLMEGTIECQSELGKGTTFTVTLDIKISEKENEEIVLPETDVLLIDSDEVILETASESLISLGAKVDAAIDGAKALELVETRSGYPYKIVIIDKKILDAEGLEFVKKIHSHKGTNILISAYDLSDVEKETKHKEIAGFIFKPLFRSKLYEKIVEIVNPELKTNHVKEEETFFNDIRVLVTEDNDINWEIISALLEMHGVECDHAQNGKAALELMSDVANENKWDLIFMDIQMPVMNGIEATKAIRKLDRDYPRNIPIVAMTADAFSENVAECLDAGMNGHIAKPIDMNLVLNEIRKIHTKKNS